MCEVKGERYKAKGERRKTKGIGFLPFAFNLEPWPL